MMSDPTAEGEASVAEDEQDAAVSVQEVEVPSSSTVTDVSQPEDVGTAVESEAIVSSSEFPSLPPAPKPLRSILKKRKPEEPAVEANTDQSTNEPAIKKPKAGSITQALKMLTAVNCADDQEHNEADPKPSAFILEMEKQKDINPVPVPVPGSLSLLDRLEGTAVVNASTGWQNAAVPVYPLSEPVNFFQQEQMRQKMKAKRKKKSDSTVDASHPISSPPVLTPTTIAVDKGPKTMMTPHEDVIEGILILTNLPFQVTVQELVKFLGIWPKGGTDGIKIITDSAGLPSGVAYVIVERHSDLMDVVRLTGFEMGGRKIKCMKVKRSNLIEDWKATKKALVAVDKSRIVKMSHLPFFLKKSELVEIVKDITFTENDIYWSPLKEGQTNSGRGFIICESSEDAKKVAEKKRYTAKARSFEVSQVHPVAFERFCAQCKMKINEDHVLTDELDNSWEDVGDLNLDPSGAPEDRYSAKTGGESSSEAKVPISKNRPGGKETSFRNRDIRPRREREMDRGPMPPYHRSPRDRPPPGRDGPPFLPTPFVRMYNVPEKSTTDEIRMFFEPVMPAKIAQNIGYDIYDIEFYSPDDAMQSMRKHRLMLRKNVIFLDMLPGPPNPLPPRPSFAGAHRPMPPQPMHPQMMPHRIEPAPPGIIPPHMGPMPHCMPQPTMGLVPPGMMQGPPGLHPGPIHPGMPSHVPMVPVPPGMLGKPMVIGMPMGRAPASVPLGPLPVAMGSVITSKSGRIDPRLMPAPMQKAESKKNQKSRLVKSALPDAVKEPRKELIPVPPLPGNFATYVLPPFKKQTPFGQGVITTMQGYFCQLCNKFYSSRTSAKDVHCKTRAHYDKLKQFLREKRRLRKLAEVDSKKK